MLKALKFKMVFISNRFSQLLMANTYKLVFLFCIAENGERSQTCAKSIKGCYKRKRFTSA